MKKIEKQVIEIMEEMRVKSLKIKNILKPEDKNWNIEFQQNGKEVKVRLNGASIFKKIDSFLTVIEDRVIIQSLKVAFPKLTIKE